MRIALSRERGAERDVSALELFFDLVFQDAALGRASRSRALGLAGLAIRAVAAAQLTLIVGIAASSGVLIAVAIGDTVQDRVQPPRRR